MESHAKLFGHPIHPFLIVFPLGLLATATIFDVLYFLTGPDILGNASFYMVVAGIIGGLLAAVFGFWDWLHIPAGTRAKSIGLWHGGGNVVIVVLFLVAVVLRRNEVAHHPSSVSLVLQLVAAGLALVTGWLGGELVDRLGVGVDPGANLNASSSLSGRPASDGATQGRGTARSRP